jgi:predicted glycogen debranching enzyme
VPLIAFRDYHGTTHENEALNPHVQIECRLAMGAPYEGLPRCMSHTMPTRSTQQAIGIATSSTRGRRERGLDFVEDLFSPFALRFDVSHRAQATIIASTARHDIRCVAEYRRAEIHRRKALVAASPADDELICRLVAAADQFIAARGDQQTIIAGYHWFTDWGRDTMISLPGLALLTGRADVARSILLGFARHIDRGMLPNRFPDVGEQPEYNTVDTTLWFFKPYGRFGNTPTTTNLSGPISTVC